MDTWEKHPQIYHYTSYEGATSILETQTLWATFYQDLNDTSEYKYFQNILSEEIISPQLGQFFIKNFRHLKDNIPDLVGGDFKAFKKSESDKIAQAMYKPLNDSELFITSFCGHSDDYTFDNGLLSQWRAYGGNNGCALVFDTKELFDVLSADTLKYSNILSLNEVIYGSKDDKNLEEAYITRRKHLEEYAGNLIDSVVFKREPASADKAWISFIEFASSYKHPAFFEEQEVRIALFNMTLGKGEKELRPTFRASNSKRVELLSDKNTKLPLKKIIVGPFEGKEERALELKELSKEVYGEELEVLISDIPLR